MEKSAPVRILLNDPETLKTLFNEHRPMRIANVWSDEPQARTLRALLEDGAALLLDGMNSWMWVPLAVKSRDRWHGVAHQKPDFLRLTMLTWLLV
ncbi:MAG: hypothetical protein IPJ47_15060 [Anaerolineales bacterium]|nr:hypothetical protein [Anaerolineales bacterium]